MCFLFGEVSSSSGCLGWATLFYCGTPWAFHIIILNISATSGPTLTKFYLNHHCGGGKAALCFGSDRIGTLVSMATDSSHMVIMGKCCQHSSAFIFDRIFFILAGNKNIHNISNVFEQGSDRTKDCGVSCP